MATIKETAQNAIAQTANNSVVELANELSAKRNQRNASNKAKKEAKETNLLKGAFSDIVSSVDKELKAETKKAKQSKTKKSKTPTEKQLKKEANKKLRDLERIDLTELLNENAKIGAQYRILCNYIKEGYLSYILSYYGYKSNNDRRKLLESITIPMLFAVGSYVAKDENGKVLGLLNKTKVVLREGTEEQKELFTHVFVQKQKYSLANVATLFIKVLRRKHETISFKSDSITMQIERYLLDKDTVVEQTIEAYKNGTITAKESAKK